MWNYFDNIVWLITFFFLLSNIFLYLRGGQWLVFSLGSYAMASFPLAVFIGFLWEELERPPLRTLAETRLWYAFFVAVIGLCIYFLYRQKWILSYASGMCVLFLLITFFNPDTINKTLMPALLSVWFVPHVVVYLFAYAMLGMASLAAIYGIYLHKTHQSTLFVAKITEQLIRVGYVFLTFGLLFGALWAKEAWGHYWTWDPKETWAFITWIGYLVYIHYKHKHKQQYSLYNFYIVVGAFLLLLMCWFGVNYLPTAKMSVHTYTG